jgi:hypothetical protein
MVEKNNCDGGENIIRGNMSVATKIKDKQKIIKKK